MPTWLIEGDATVYFLLGLGFIICFALWWRTRKRSFAVGAGIFAALIVGYYLLDRFVESDGEQMARKVSEVADGVSRNDLEAAFRHVSEQFQCGGYNKKQFHDFCQQTRAHGQVTEVKVWDLEPEDVSRPSKTGTVQFRFKVAGSWGELPPHYIARVYFVLDPDGQWRVRSFDIFNSLNQSNTPEAIPGWGSR
jgi:hypothetical protein